MHKHIVTHIFSIDYGLLFFDFKNRSRKQYVDNLNLIFSKISCSCVDANYVLVQGCTYGNESDEARASGNSAL